MKFTTLLKKISKKRMDYFHKARYIKYYEKLPIRKNVILLEQQRGKNPNGNIHYLVEELCKDSQFDQYEVYYVYSREKKKDYRDLLEGHRINGVHLVRLESRKYYRLCASAEYLINDTSFLPFFIKKEGQKYLNTWHGTPLKCLGKQDNSGYHNLGNVQRNFIFSDLLLYPNQYMRNHMIEDYMLENLTDARCLMAGYPRNSVFFDHESKKTIFNKLKETGLINESVEHVYAYMPTWRGTVSCVNKEMQTIYTMFYLLEIEKRLADDEILFVNLHPFVNDSIDYSVFKHILPFPKQYETYEFLNVADVLITDYSSVFYDFANTRRKIVLFTYDADEYFADRGVYCSLDSLPFPKVETVRDLITELRTPKNYDDSSFIEEYCSLDKYDISKKILKSFLFGSKELEILEIPKNGKDNVLIYAGNMAKNGITTSLLSLLNNIDLKKRNYFITFTVNKVRRNKEEILKLPDGVNYIPMMGVMDATILDKVLMILYRCNLMPSKLMQKKFDKLYKYDIRRYYYDAPFKNVIQFNGYEYKRILEFGRFDSNRIIFVHNNMVKEIETRQNQHKKTLVYAYNTYDKVAIVTEDMMDPTMEFCHDKSRIRLANNTIDYQKIQEMGNLPIKYDDTTVCRYTAEELYEVLNDKTYKTFITIGRFSPEKGHLRLLDAFNTIWEQDHKVKLVIIGGHGVEYEHTLDYASSLPCNDDVIIIKSMSNPQSVLKLCDYFVLSSFYEGLGLVLMEADIQGLPVMSTDILGPRGFLKEYNGLLVENSTEGIIDGMKKMKNGLVKPLHVDYQKYNEKAVQQFENLLV